jgi:hypothetical protein
MADGAIDKNEFAKNAIQRGLLFGVNSHYLIAVAHLRSGLTSGEENGKIGPFRYTQELWDANNAFPDLEFSLKPADIKSWRKQTTFAGVGELRSQDRLLKSLGRFPSALELYKDQYPDDPDGLPAKLQVAVDATRADYLAAVNALFPGQSSPIGNVEDKPAPGDHPQPTASIGQFAPLLDFIAKPESGGNYNAYFGHGNNKNNPELVSMTISQIFAFQKEFTDGGQPSAAAGKYQIIRKTLRELVDKGNASASDLFDQATQDKLAEALLKKRGLDRFLSGALSDEDFALNLAMEWASLPVPRNTQGQFRPVTKGQSFYAGDGLNKSLVTVSDFLTAIGKIKPT